MQSDFSNLCVSNSKWVEEENNYHLVYSGYFNSPGTSCAWFVCSTQCDYEDLLCFICLTGRGCEVEQQFVCSDNETEKWTAIYGSWRVSICGAYCDKKLSFCYCGEGTKYPQRPVAESCGFSM